MRFVSLKKLYETHQFSQLSTKNKQSFERDIFRIVFWVGISMTFQAKLDMTHNLKYLGLKLRIQFLFNQE